MKTLILAGLGLLAAPVLAQMPPSSVPPSAPSPGRAGNPGARDGVQLRTDVSPRVQRMFAVMDTNHDGVIDQAELAAMQAGMADRASNGDGGQRPAGMGMARMIGMLDTNHDGRITVQEATDMLLRRFDRMDTNHDGQLTSDERAAAREQMRQLRGEQ